jgi:hypothetical protein
VRRINENASALHTIILFDADRQRAMIKISRVRECLLGKRSARTYIKHALHSRAHSLYTNLKANPPPSCCLSTEMSISLSACSFFPSSRVIDAPPPPLLMHSLFTYCECCVCYRFDCGSNSPLICHFLSFKSPPDTDRSLGGARLLFIACQRAALREKSSNPHSTCRGAKWQFPQQSKHREHRTLQIM